MPSGFVTEMLDAKVVGLRDRVALSPKGTRRFRLKTLLRLFGIKVRTQPRLELLESSFQEAGLHSEPTLVSCGREDWVSLSLLHKSADSNIGGSTWLDTLASKTFATEKEVEIRFIIPLLDHLGYSEEDRADGCPIEMTIGSRKARGEADFVLYDGRNRSRENVLLVVEAKRTGIRLDPHIDQARSYAMFLGAPYYLVTNGDDLRVFEFKSALETDREVFHGTRSTLKAHWDDLVNIISKGKASSTRIALRKSEG